ncbi:MAG: sigma-B regulation protein RsbQ [Solirubrobacteraceae bacterium]|jgi:sigma-B regulation protein RsbQ|nr:sigma-B regulation protein RsbQ [Solirubrobacteraceae bacterium]
MIGPGSASAVIARNNVRVTGRPGGRPIVFVHGFGCDQTLWRFVAPAFEDRFRVVLYDHVGSGASDLAAYDPARYASLDAYASDLLEICRELDLSDAVLVGHSVGAMIAALAAVQDPRRFAKLVLIAPSPRYLDDDGYAGGFSRADVDGLLESLAGNYLGWSAAMAPAFAGAPAGTELAGVLTNAFCRTDPAIAHQFARVTFLSDTRAALPNVSLPSLIVQCSDDFVVPCAVGDYMQGAMPDAELVVLDTVGHCPHLSSPGSTIDAIGRFL